jgi:hypothetical protein
MAFDNRKKPAGKYYHYPVELPNSEHLSRGRRTNWAIGYRPNVGDKLRKMPHVNPHLIAAYDHEWQASTHANKLNQEVDEMFKPKEEDNG